jgi:hypothetical protein
MLFYKSTIHDLIWPAGSCGMKSARSTLTPPVLYVRRLRNTALVAGAVNLKCQRGAIGTIECYVQAVLGYDIRTKIVGSKGSILVGSLQWHFATVLTSNGGTQTLEDYFLARFADAYLVEVMDFVQHVLNN